MIADHDGNVIPRGGAPVWIVITLLRYFQAPPRSCRILPRVDWQITFEFLISGKQTCSQLKQVSVNGDFNYGSARVETERSNTKD